MLIFFVVEMTVSDADAATNYTLPYTINNAPHIPNATTSPHDASTTEENKTSMGKIIDGQ